MTEPFATKTGGKGARRGSEFRVLREGRVVAFIKPRQPRAGEIEALRALIEGKGE